MLPTGKSSVKKPTTPPEKKVIDKVNTAKPIPSPQFWQNFRIRLQNLRQEIKTKEVKASNQEDEKWFKKENELFDYKLTQGEKSDKANLLKKASFREPVKNREQEVLEDKEAKIKIQGVLTLALAEIFLAYYIETLYMKPKVGLIAEKLLVLADKLGNTFEEIKRESRDLATWTQKEIKEFREKNSEIAQQVDIILSKADLQTFRDADLSKIFDETAKSSVKPQAPSASKLPVAPPKSSRALAAEPPKQAAELSKDSASQLRA